MNSLGFSLYKILLSTHRNSIKSFFSAWMSFIFSFCLIFQIRTSSTNRIDVLGHPYFDSDMTIKAILYSWDKFHLLTVYNHFYILLGFVCWYFEDFCRYFYRSNCSIALFFFFPLWCLFLVWISKEHWILAQASHTLPVLRLSQFSYLLYIYFLLQI